MPAGKNAKVLHQANTRRINAKRFLDKYVSDPDAYEFLSEKEHLEKCKQIIMHLQNLAFPEHKPKPIVVHMEKDDPQYNILYGFRQGNFIHIHPEIINKRVSFSPLKTIFFINSASFQYVWP